MNQQDGSGTSDASVLSSLTVYGPQTMDQLTQSVANMTWPQIFGSIDRLSRMGLVVLKPAGGDYEVALSPKNGKARPM